MCGISCYLHFDSKTKCHPLNIQASLDCINHRGPDSRGVYTSPDERCVLGHTRLSIIDLKGGKQPLVSKCGKIHCVVNGELYNFKSIRANLESKGHVFSTNSDSEVALHLYEEYGLSFVDYLRGEFAICIWDERTKRMIAVKDRFGIKPLHYTVANNTLFLASEIKAFLPLGWKAEWDVPSLVHSKYFFGNRTVFKDVYKIPPAHYLIADSNGAIQISPYWAPDYPDKHIKENRSVEEMIQGVRERLVDAVEQRLIADIPVGVYLSGGIDSSVIAGIASSVLKKKNPNARIRAFSISFTGGGILDEGDISRRTAEFCDADQEVIGVNDKEILDNFEEVVWHGEQPVSNFSTVSKALLSKKAHESGYKVILSGEGSDEIFGGYGFFMPEFLRESDLTMAESFHKLSERDRIAMLIKRESTDMAFFNEDSIEKASLSSNDKGASNQMNKYKQTSNSSGINNFLPKKMLNNINVPSSLSTFFRFEDTIFSNRVLQIFGRCNPILSAAEMLDGITRVRVKNKWHPLHTAFYVENRSMLSNYFCGVMGDRTEMMNSVEGRTPFLDHLLCEYVNSLPPSVKIKYEGNGKLNEKWILKEASKPFITKELYERTKQPFVAPCPNETSPVIINFINQFITKKNIDRLGWADFKNIEKEKQRYFKEGDAGAFMLLLNMLSFVMISQRFNVATYDGSNNLETSHL